MNTDGTIIEFLLGSHSFDGVWYGDAHPTQKGEFWWRRELRKYLNEQPTTEPQGGELINACKHLLHLNNVDMEGMTRVNPSEWYEAFNKLSDIIYPPKTEL